MARPAKLSPHLSPLLPGRWAIWREFAVRDPGFPVDGLDDFGISENELLRARSRDPRFYEAVLWQNAAAARSAISKLAKESTDKTDSKSRQRRELTASYWQRYCAKNETIGFFGPLGWGQFSQDGPPINVQPGDNPIAARYVRFEVWTIETLADAIAANPLVRPHVPPHRNPDKSPEDLLPEQLKAWKMCDGIRPACAAGAADVIEALQKEKYIRVTFPIPLCLDPERELRLQLSRLKPESARLIALASLDALETARRQVVLANAPEELDRALGTLDDVFLKLTGTSPTRKSGEHYAARTLVHLDCRRDLCVEIGPILRENLAETLEPVLAGSRWFCGEVARVCHDAVERAVDDLRKQMGIPILPFRAVSSVVIPLLRGSVLGIRQVSEELQFRWTKLLADTNPIGFGARATAIFADAKPGWRWATWQSPDIQIAASDIHAINCGDFRIVVSDFHLSNTLMQGLFTMLNPTPDALIAAANQDLPAPRLELAPDRDTPRLTGRTTQIFFSPEDVLILADPKASLRFGMKGLAASDLMVANSPNGSIVTTQHGKVVGALDELFASLYNGLAQSMYNPFVQSSHAPRIQVGHSVFRRETWNLPSRECQWAFLPDSASRSVAFENWVKEKQMPSRLFTMVPGETKPRYVDSRSPVLIDIVAKAVRGSGRLSESYNNTVTFTEMLPTPDQCWLADAKGNRYTCELRMVAVDLNSPWFKKRH